MDKQFADKMIQKFQKIFYGFALSKSYSLEEAEELAARIVFEAYASLLKVDDITNWEAYLYRIAQNIYARYVKEKKRYEELHVEYSPEILQNLQDNSNVFDADFAGKLIKSEEYCLLRREIAWLSKVQREVVYRYYYENQKISAISKALDLPEGTVKWHLHDAKKVMKEGMEKMRKYGELGIHPIEFCGMGHSGYIAERGNTDDYLNSRLRQNIAYAAYYEAKTVEEIAEELGVSLVYVEDEVLFLEENGFLDKVGKNKYLTNIYIINEPKEVYEKKYEIEKEIAKLICRDYVPLIFKAFKDYKKMGIYVPEDDMNYLMWSMVMRTLSIKMSAIADWNILSGTNYRVKRKDGGEYIAIAHVYREDLKELKLDAEHYAVCGDMTRGSCVYPIYSWQISTSMDSREFGFEDNRTSDYENLYLYMTGKLEKTDATLEKYKRLYERGLLVNQKVSGEETRRDKVNVVIVKGKAQNMEACRQQFDDKTLPDFPEKLVKEIKKLQDKMYELEKEYYPKHMHKLLKFYITDHVNRIMIIDELLESGMLLPLTAEQKKGVFIVVFSDVTESNYLLTPTS